MMATCLHLKSASTTLSRYFFGFREFNCFHDQFVLAIFRLRTLLHVMETQLVLHWLFTCHGAYLVEEEVVDVVGEEGSELALLRLAGAHVHLDLLNESAVKRDSGHEGNSCDLALWSHDLMNRGWEPPLEMSYGPINDSCN